MKTIRWGIIGAGGIAERFAQACKNVEGASLEAIASRSIDKANAFADRFGIEHRFGSYEEMAAWDGIDAAYVATPHATHGPFAILFMNKGKHILSEKPITVNCHELQKMIDCAAQNKVFLMEGMWARFVPGILKVLEIVESGAIGDIRGIQGSFCYEMADEPEHHAFKPLYGGGSLLDVGCYCLSFASWFMTSPVVQIEAVADVGERTQVDEHCCYLLKYENGAIASLSSAMMVRKPSDGYLFGTKGYIYLKGFYSTRDFEVHIEGGETTTYNLPYNGNGFEYEIMEANQCIREGKLQSDIMSHAQSMKIMEQMDAIRKKVGVKYPLDVD